MKFLEMMAKKAEQNIKTIVLPESTDIRVLEAASVVSSKGFANIVLIGEEEKIKNIAGDLDLSKVKIVNHLKESNLKLYSELFYEMRKSKGLTLEESYEIMKDPIYYGVMMVKENVADGMVAGAIHSTPNTIRPALQIIKTAKNIEMISSFLVMVVPDKKYGNDGIFIFSDCGLVENPSSKELCDIALASANSFKALFEAEPSVAMLSYSTYGSAKSELTKKVVDATLLAREKSPDLIIDGELQADAAIVPSVAQFKAKGSIVEGKANVLIFPDLNSGNISCKLVQRLGNAELYGPITQGLAKPVNDLSRGCNVEDIVGAIAITCVQAQFLSQHLLALSNDIK